MVGGVRVLVAFVSLASLVAFHGCMAGSIPFTTLELNGPVSHTYTLECSAYKYFRVNMTYACKDLNITLNVFTGSPDIYVSRDLDVSDGLTDDSGHGGVFSYPTIDSLTWASFVDSNTNLQPHVFISHWDPESAPGNYDIAIYNDCSRQSNFATFTIQTILQEDDSNDILVHPHLAMNHYLPANDYVFFRFCVEGCADTTVTLQNCMNGDVCPQNYSFPELLVSRTEVNPTLNSYSYKLASDTRRSNYIFHNDSTARDKNGFVAGSYYVGVYGYCTPPEYAVDDVYSGPCKFAQHVFFNVTVHTHFRK